MVHVSDLYVSVGVEEHDADEGEHFSSDLVVASRQVRQHLHDHVLGVNSHLQVSDLVQPPRQQQL